MSLEQEGSRTKGRVSNEERKLGELRRRLREITSEAGEIEKRRQELMRETQGIRFQIVDIVDRMQLVLTLEEEE